MTTKTPQAQLEAVQRQREKNKRQGKRSLVAVVSKETAEALDYLRKTTPGGFNYRQFVEDKILEEAEANGFKP